MNITVTDAAERFLADLVSKQSVKGMSVRLFVTEPGTPYAETCLAYCAPTEVNPNDFVFDAPSLRFYIDNDSRTYLDQAVIDFIEDRMGGQLSIEAPNAKMPALTDESSMTDRVNYILYTEINPGLASHGGEVRLVELLDTKDGIIAVLKFGGGCQGCKAVDLTLKDGVEKTLITQIDGLAGVKDITDHTQTDQAYYQ